MARVTGVGGVFFKCKGDPAALRAWYGTYLGLKFEPFGGAILRWPDDTADDKGVTVWCLAKPDSKWFAPSDAPFMINYRVDDLDGILAQLRAGGVEPLKGPDSDGNGRFVWVLDPDGNKIELWEPKAWEEKDAAT